MTDERRPQPCRWLRLTIDLPYPYWLAAEQQPWSCLRDPEPRPLDTTEECRDCARWEVSRDARTRLRI